MKQFKTNNINDTEMVYSLLREKYPKQQVEIEYNDNTKDYVLYLSDDLFKEDPEVPVDIKIKVIYGDSQTGCTPVLLKRDNLVYIEKLESIFDEDKKFEYPGFKLFDKYVRLEKEYCKTNYEVWTDIGWSSINKVIRHKSDKEIYKIVLKSGCVKVTEDGSLINEEYKIMTPKECNLETKLLTSYPSTFNYDYYISRKNAYLYGKDVYIPIEMLNSNICALESFFDGYFDYNRNIICIKGQINASRMYYLMIKYGYNVLIEEDDDIYNLIIINNFEDNVDLNKINKIKLDSKSEYVYDLETECGRYQSGVGNIIVKNTDSIFISMKFNRDDFKKNREDAFNMGIICGDNLTKDIFNRNPIELEFEKVFQPFILLTKKRYIGKKYENIKDPFKLKEITKAGTAASKRNYSACIKNCYNEIIDCIVNGNENSISESVDIYKKFLDKIDNYQIEVDELVVSAQLAKNYSCALCKVKCEWNHLICENKKCKVISPPKSIKCKCNSNFKCIHNFSLAHVTLAINMLSRNEEANVNDRIPYLYVENSDLKIKKSDLAEDPKFFVNNKLRYNRIYYTESLGKTILSFFKVVLNEYKDLLNDAIDYTNEKLVNYGAKKLRPSDFKIEEE